MSNFWRGEMAGEKKMTEIAARERKSHTLDIIYCGAPSW
jgi:hypothetical protein